jgi:hypothetical protein
VGDHSTHHHGVIALFRCVSIYLCSRFETYLDVLKINVHIPYGCPWPKEADVSSFQVLKQVRIQTHIKHINLPALSPHTWELQQLISWVEHQKPTPGGEHRPAAGPLCVHSGLTF